MNDLIERITNAIFRQEGMPPTWTNPGNLRSAPWRINPPTVNGFWRPATRAEGVAGAAHCVALRIAEGQSLSQLIAAWAPPSENNTGAYLANVKEWAAIPDVNVPLWNFL
jgi:hypothetical protein